MSVQIASAQETDSENRGQALFVSCHDTIRKEWPVTQERRWRKSSESKQGRRLLAPLPNAVSFATKVEAGATFIHLFVSERKTLETELKRIRKLIADTGTLWVSWPKKSSGVATDVTEDVIREIALPLGFVDVKVCAVNETWSGLKLMIRRENRR